jgi:serine/threonine protein kinase
MAMGTVAYMSPEQARGEKLDARTDLFSLGVVLYEMATGHQALAGDTAAEVHDAILNRTPPSALQWNPQLPPELGRIISRALEKDRDARYQAATELRAHLDSLKRVQGPAMRWKWYLRVGAMVAVLVEGAVVAWLVWHRTRTLPELTQLQLTANSFEEPVISGAISPDGKYLPYTDLSGIHIKLSETGEKQTIPQPEIFGGGRVEWRIASWFPGSTRFLANVSEPERRQLFAWWSFPKLNHASVWMVSVMGGAPRKLRDDAYAWCLAGRDFGRVHEEGGIDW